MISQYNVALSSLSQRQKILESPTFFLHSINFEDREFEFVATSRDALSKLSFIDGRSSLSLDTQVWRIPVDECLAWHTQTSKPKQVNRFIFHTSFCGSTLLARTLDIKGATFSYKEPNILSQLAQVKSEGEGIYKDHQRWKAIIKFALDQLKQQWSNTEATLIKPSNWANLILSDLMCGNGDSKAVLLSSAPEEFLTAVFRGGSDRVRYTYRLLKHLETAFPEYSEIIEHTENSQQPPIDTFMRLSLITHSMQVKTFDHVQSLVEPSKLFHLSFSDLLSDPVQGALNAASALELPVSASAIQESVDVNLKHHSKVTNRPFSVKEMIDVDNAVVAKYQANIQAAMDWNRTTLKTVI